MKKLVLSREIHRLAQRLVGEGFRLFVVGGAVRDWLLEQDYDDLDFVVIGGTLDDVVAVFKRWYTVKVAIVADAPVFQARIGRDWVDVAVGRKEALRDGVEDTGRDSDLVFETGAHITIEDDLARRDLTINAIAYDVLTKQVVDPHNGARDLFWPDAQGNKVGRLMPPGPFFSQEASRPIRAARFAAQLGMPLTVALVEVCQSMADKTMELVPPEQWWKQMKKLLLSADPARGFRALKTFGLADKLPGWSVLEETEQDPVWHREGNVMIHSLKAGDVARKLTAGLPDEQAFPIVMAAFLHDIGKGVEGVTHRHPETGRWVSPGHDRAGLDVAKEFLRVVGFPKRLRPKVLKLIETHMRRPETHKAVRKLVRDLDAGGATLFEWAILCKADMASRDLDHEELAAAFIPIEKAFALGVEAAIEHSAPDIHREALVTGKLLIQHKLVAPGPEMGRVMAAAFEAQLDKQFDTAEAGIEWVKAHAL